MGADVSGGNLSIAATDPTSPCSVGWHWRPASAVAAVAGLMESGAVVAGDATRYGHGSTHR